MTKKDTELFVANGLHEEAYSSKVEELIRRRYSISAEFAVIRQKDKKPDEWEAYDAYCEQCKKEAKAIIYGG